MKNTTGIFICFIFSYSAIFGLGRALFEGSMISPLTSCESIVFSARVSSATWLCVMESCITTSFSLRTFSMPVTMLGKM